MITTDGYREKSSDRIIFMCIIEKVTAIWRVTAIGYWPAIGCNILTFRTNYPAGGVGRFFFCLSNVITKKCLQSRT